MDVSAPGISVEAGSEGSNSAVAIVGAKSLILHLAWQFAGALDADWRNCLFYLTGVGLVGMVPAEPPVPPPLPPPLPPP